MSVPKFLRNALVALAATAQAQGGESVLPAGTVTVTPVFHELVRVKLPSGFQPGQEQANATNYLRESVLRGETVNRWTQMVTVSASNEAAAVPDFQLSRFLDGMRAGFQRSCPESFAQLNLPEQKVSGHDALRTVLSCGSIAEGGPYSETALIVAVRGARDLYSFQWAQRAAASPRPLRLQASEWEERYRRLGPIALCKPTPGEAAPYPSCVNQR